MAKSRCSGAPASLIRVVHKEQLGKLELGEGDLGAESQYKAQGERPMPHPNDSNLMALPCRVRVLLMSTRAALIASAAG